ncbi:HD-GYP domain-containing protein [Deinococcus sp. MIMF12]|uniref:HD-GYP domain-containing protein n=1 Tax=Deinococcus rhizophilus TaxID=3049544 RepID=A0ABT7JL66_9DEIO|nr:HD-GYP domain-containing protein [Deinococcus rhizophilus]MDL2345795.1 HD-GYP domain-containing protein [Deinococcus rhizophilus]
MPTRARWPSSGPTRPPAPPPPARGRCWPSGWPSKPATTRPRATPGAPWRWPDAWAGRLGRALGLDEAAQGHLRQGAYLHDIGKLSVPDGVLLKPGPLTSEERAQMQRHVLTGEALVRRIPGMPREVLEVVRSHHERWDGAGYPDGLAGEAIPRLARIFWVIDVFDALTQQRPYRAPLSVPGALALIRAEAGRQFDAGVVAAFLTLFVEPAAVAPGVVEPGVVEPGGPEPVRGREPF